MDYDLLGKLANFKVLYQDHLYEPLELIRLMSDALYRENVFIEAEESGNTELALLSLQIKIGLGHFNHKSANSDSAEFANTIENLAA